MPPLAVRGARLHMAFEVAEQDHRTVRLPRRAAMERAHPGAQLGRVERLGHIIVDAGIEAFGAVLRASQCRQHEDRRRDPRLAQALDDLDPGQIGKHAIEDDDVERGAGRALQSFLAAVGPGKAVAFGGHQPRHLFGEPRVVFHV